MIAGIDVPCSVAAPEHAIGEKVEIAGAVVAVEGRYFLAILHVQPDRLSGIVVHACVHRRDDMGSIIAHGLFQRGEAAQGAAVGSVQAQCDFGASRIDDAVREPAAFEDL
ncbi:hypothetical protein [Croceicoccus bisphenolivorans]|uniref:hypothetical protein n=1 Tax=Croceicoccus bisphenolivorans TaxID=1783232 RepID=UPI001FE22352|nr:hypothetical protein [Croceicoccus bisphenolivorans]